MRNFGIIRGTFGVLRGSSKVFGVLGGPNTKVILEPTIGSLKRGMKQTSF